MCVCMCVRVCVLCVLCVCVVCVVCVHLFVYIWKYTLNKALIYHPSDLHVAID